MVVDVELEVVAALEHEDILSWRERRTLVKLAISMLLVRFHLR